MSLLILGESVVFGTATGFAETHYSPWMPAGGNNGVAGLEIFYLSAANELTVEMETKSSDATDTGVSSIGSLLLSSTVASIYKFDVNDAQDLVRYKLSNDDESVSIHFQFVQPFWAAN